MTEMEISGTTTTAMGNDTVPLCAICGIAALYTCRICRSVHFCSLECQQTDWTTHKLICGIYEKEFPVSPQTTHTPNENGIKHGKRNGDTNEEPILALRFRVDMCAPEALWVEFNQVKVSRGGNRVEGVTMENESLESLMESMFGGKVWMEEIKWNFTRDRGVGDGLVVVGGVLGGDGEEEEGKRARNASVVALMEMSDMSIKPGIAKKLREVNRQRIIQEARSNSHYKPSVEVLTEELPPGIFKGPLILIARMGQDFTNYRSLTPQDFRHFVDWINIRSDPLLTNPLALKQRSRKIQGIRINSQKYISQGHPRFQTVFFPQDHPIFSEKDRCLWPGECDGVGFKMRRVSRLELGITHHSFIVKRDTDPKTWDMEDWIRELCARERRDCSWPFSRALLGGNGCLSERTALKLADGIRKRCLKGEEFFGVDRIDLEGFLRDGVRIGNWEEREIVLEAVAHLKERSQHIASIFCGPNSNAKLKNIDDYNILVSALQLLTDPLLQSPKNQATNAVAQIFDKKQHTSMPLPEWMLPAGSYHFVRADKKDLQIWELEAVAEFVVKRMNVAGRGLDGYWEMGREVLQGCGWEGFRRFLGVERVGKGWGGIEDFLSGKIVFSEPGESLGQVGGRPLSGGGVDFDHGDDMSSALDLSAGVGISGIQQRDVSETEVIDLTGARSRSVSPFVPDVDLTMEPDSMLDSALDDSKAMEIDQDDELVSWKASRLGVSSSIFAQQKVSDTSIEKNLVVQPDHSSDSEENSTQLEDSGLLNKEFRNISAAASPSILPFSTVLVENPLSNQTPNHSRSQSSSSSLSSMMDEELEVLEREVAQPMKSIEEMPSTPITGKAKPQGKPSSSMFLQSPTTSIRGKGRKCYRCQRKVQECSKDKPSCTQCIEDNLRCIYYSDTSKKTSESSKRSEAAKDSAENNQVVESKDADVQSTKTSQPAVPASREAKNTNAKGNAVESPASSTRRCERCAKLKIGCGMELPRCARCEKRDTECIYPVPSSTPRGNRKILEAVTDEMDTVDELQEDVASLASQPPSFRAPGLKNKVVDSATSEADTMDENEEDNNLSIPLPQDYGGRPVYINGKVRRDFSRIVDSKRVMWTSTNEERGFYYKLEFKRMTGSREQYAWRELSKLVGFEDEAAQFHVREPWKLKPTVEELRRAGFAVDEEAEEND